MFANLDRWTRSGHGGKATSIRIRWLLIIEVEGDEITARFDAKSFCTMMVSPLLDPPRAHELIANTRRRAASIPSQESMLKSTSGGTFDKIY